MNLCSIVKIERNVEERERRMQSMDLRCKGREVVVSEMTTISCTARGLDTAGTTIQS